MSRLQRILKSPGKYLSPKHIINNVISGRLFLIWRTLSVIIPSDRLFLKIYYRLAMHEKLDLKNPETFTQKIQWLKLHNTDPIYSQMVDKFEVRKIITKKLGEAFLIPLLGVWTNFDEIDFSTLPDQFVLKTTHDSGNVVICKNKSLLDVSNAKRKLSKALKRNYFYKSREYPYKNAIPRIIAEKYMVGDSQSELVDYKFFCFNGEPKILLVVTDRSTGKSFNYFDIEFNPLPFSTGFDGMDITFLKPDNYLEMIEIARHLSKNIIHVRIDLYNIDGRIFFGEYTFHHGGGVDRFNLPEWNKQMGDLIILPSLSRS